LPVGPNTDNPQAEIFVRILSAHSIDFPTGLCFNILMKVKILIDSSVIICLEDDPSKGSMK